MAQDLTNTTWGFSKVGYVHLAAMDAVAAESCRQQSRFQASCAFLPTFQQLWSCHESPLRL
eukprot:3374383-Amphidinium_carterae.2